MARRAATPSLFVAVAVAVVVVVVVAATLCDVARAAIVADQGNALTTFFQACGGAQWTSRASSANASAAQAWNDAGVGDACDDAWLGVTCDAAGNVVDLIVERNNVECTQLPGTALATLTALRQLNLQDNSVRGTLPPALASLTSLAIVFLGRNSLSGTIADAFATQLPAAQFLYLHDNSLSGALPDALFAKPTLVNLDVSNNQLTATLPGASTWHSAFVALSLAGNAGVMGTLPSFLGSALPALKYIDVSATSLSGVLPSSLSSAPQLEDLFLNHTLVSGTVPSLVNVPLVRLDLSGATGLAGSPPPLVGNRIAMLRLSGVAWGAPSPSPSPMPSIPDAYAQYPSLAHFDMSSCSLRGTIPSGFAVLPELQTINVQHNSLSGVVPAFVEANLDYLLLSHNRLSGGIPLELAERATQTEVIELHANSLSGSVPSRLFNMQRLRILTLQQNSLSGRLAIDDDTAVAPLLILQLAHNRLSGVLPAALGAFDNTLETLTLDHNRFSGTLPQASLDRLQSLVVLRVENNLLSGALPLALNMGRLSTCVVDAPGDSRDGTMYQNSFCCGFPGTACAPSPSGLFTDGGCCYGVPTTACDVDTLWCPGAARPEPTPLGGAPPAPTPTPTPISSTPTPTPGVVVRVPTPAGFGAPEAGVEVQTTTALVGATSVTVHLRSATTLDQLATLTVDGAAFAGVPTPPRATSSFEVRVRPLDPGDRTAALAALRSGRSVFSTLVRVDWLDNPAVEGAVLAQLLRVCFASTTASGAPDADCLSVYEPSRREWTCVDRQLSPSPDDPGFRCGSFENINLGVALTGVAHHVVAPAPSPAGTSSSPSPPSSPSSPSPSPPSPPSPPPPSSSPLIYAAVAIGAIIGILALGAIGYVLFYLYRQRAHGGRSIEGGKSWYDFGAGDASSSSSSSSVHGAATLEVDMTQTQAAQTMEMTAAAASATFDASPQPHAGAIVYE